MPDILIQVYSRMWCGIRPKYRPVMINHGLLNKVCDDFLQHFKTLTEAIRYQDPKSRNGDQKNLKPKLEKEEL